MKLFFFLILASCLSQTAFSMTFGKGNGRGMLRISPVVGYEQVQKNTPTPHTKNRLYYGIGIEVGPRIFSIELQGTQAKDTESYDSTTIEETSQRASIGFKSYFSAASALSFYMRGGARGQKIKTDTTVDGTTTSKTSAFYVDPYVGTGIRISAANVMNVSLGVTAVFSDYPNPGKIEYQTNFSIGMHF